jgi:hypothetical protein
MTNQKPQTNQSERHIEGYRGALVYSQQQGYKLVTLAVTLYPGEQNQVTTSFYGHSTPEEPEHWLGVDLYQFLIAEGTDIELTVSTLTGETQAALYTMLPNGVVAGPSPQIWLDITESTQESWSMIPLLIESTQESWSMPPLLDVEEAFYDAITYYKNKIPEWLESVQERLDLETDVPLSAQADDFE